MHQAEGQSAFPQQRGGACVCESVRVYLGMSVCAFGWAGGGVSFV